MKIGFSHPLEDFSKLFRKFAVPARHIQ